MIDFEITYREFQDFLSAEFPNLSFKNVVGRPLISGPTKHHTVVGIETHITFILSVFKLEITDRPMQYSVAWQHYLRELSIKMRERKELYYLWSL